MFLETAEGVIELKEDGTYVKHSCRFHNVNGRVFKEDLATKNMQIVPPSVLFTVDDVTGEIEGEQRGFVLDHEFNMPVHPTTGKKYLKVLDNDIPVDFKREVPIEGSEDKTLNVINYKVNSAGELERKV